MKFFLIILVLFPTLSFPNEKENPIEEKISIFFDISVEKCTINPHECVSGIELSDSKEILLKEVPGAPEGTLDGWLTLSKTLYGKEYKCNVHMQKFVYPKTVFYFFSAVLYYVIDGELKTIQFSSVLKSPNDLNNFTIQGPSFGTPELNYAPIVMFGGTHLEEKK